MRPSPVDPVWRELKKKVRKKCGGKCAYCGAEEKQGAISWSTDRSGRRVKLYVKNGLPMVIDHIIPIAKGGTNNEDNLVLACGPCNASKGAKVLADWRDRP